LYQVHEWDGQTPLEETLHALDLLVTSGKVRYVGASNYASWQLMKALGTAERLGLPQFVSQQIYYSLQSQESDYHRNLHSFPTRLASVASRRVRLKSM